MRKFYLLTLLFSILVLGVSLASAQDQERKDSAMSIQQQQKKAWREKGLHEAAKITGSLVRFGDPTQCTIFDLPSIAEQSDLIVTGYIQDNVCKLYNPGDQEEIITEYKVQVGEVLKGKKNLSGKVIEVNTKGGKIIFSDGTFAEISSSDRKMRNGNRYVLFLSELGKEKKRLIPFAMTSGVFEITNEGKIIFCGGGMFSPAQLTEPNLTRQTGRSVEEFLQEVRSLVTN
jgi:hypothetical protein